MTARPLAPVRALLAGALALLLSAGVLGTALVGTAQAADPVVAAAPRPSTVTADPLPTVQINGIVYAQAVAGNTVYVAGRFTTARPAGAAPGTQEVSRNNMLAYDIRTGVLVNSFNPNLDGQGLTLSVSPDGRRVYVGGDFRNVGGVARSRIAAFDTATGALVSTFAPVVTGQVQAIAATNDKVFIGGNLTAVGNTSRTRLAAVTTTGALLPWAPVPGVGAPDSGGRTSNAVRAMVLTGGGSQVVLGGHFYSMNGNVSRGVAAVDGTTGASLPFAMGQTITNEGANSAVYSLSTDGTSVFGTAYDYYGPGNLEASFAATVDGGRVVWMNGCHGDTYSAAPHNGVLYSAGHPHVCEAIGDFPEQEPRFHQYSLATTTTATGTNVGWDFNGQPSPQVLNWRPVFSVGTVSGAYQAGWSVAASGDYVLYGGEFPRVSNVPQQGLVRFAVPAVAPRKIGPNVNEALTPTVTSVTRGAVRVQWKSTFDPDDGLLTYRVTRGDRPTVPVYETTVESAWWKRPALGFIDRNVTPGTRYSYRVTAVDDDGNIATWSTASAVASDAVLTPYAATVLADSPTASWPLAGLTGTASPDQVGLADVTVGTGMTPADGSPLGTGTSLRADGTKAGRGTVSATDVAVAAPDTFSLELWFSTTSTTGGRVAGYGNSPVGNNSGYDRMLFLDKGGRLTFGVYTGATETITSRAGLNDGTWHHVVAQLSPAGQTLFVDGLRVGTNPSVTAGQPYAGWWQFGGGSLGGWAGDRSTEEFTGQLSQAAVYPTALSVERIRAHYTATGRVVDTPARPTDAYGAAVYADAPSFAWRFQDAAGSNTVANSADGGYTGSVQGSVARQAPGAPMPGVVDPRGVALDGSGGFVSGSQRVSNPTTFSVETWFNTTSTDGGRLIGFGSNAEGYSSSYDRMVYMFADGRLRFGVWTGREQVIESPVAYNDGAWHHVVATMGPAGMTMYVDGISMGTNPNTSVQPYDGYWRVGADSMWGGARTSSLTGRLDEAAVYPTQLTQAQVAAHYTAAGGTLPTRPADAYGAAVYDSNPSAYWRMGDTSGSTAASAAPTGGAGVYTGSPSTGVAGPQLAGVADNRAVGFDGVDDGLYASRRVSNPGTFSQEFWFNTTTTAGGKLIGFGDRQTGYSNNYDRHVYLEPDGRLTFGTFTGVSNLVQTALPYNDGRWHHVVSTLGADGMRLYVDGQQMGANPKAGAQDYDGYWRVGGDTPWSGAGYAAATIDEVAVFDRALDAQEVTGHYTAATGPLDTAPTAAFTSTATGLTVAFDGQTSADAEGAVRTWAWDFGDGSTGTGSTVSHTYAATGTHDVTLTVTDSAGQTGRTTMTVTVTAPPPNQAPTAAFTSVVDDLRVSVDAAASSDADGTVTGYAWQFGDGSTATGRTATHVYGSAGPRTVTLTVTDDDGDSTTVTREVTVTAPNQPPVAAFTTSATDLVVGVDGRTSTDSDGQVRSWAWDFGDGGTATGAQATHTYAAAGTFAVRLTVTDDRGATVTTTQSVTVTVTPPPNAVPTAALTASVTDLTAALDGRTSTDSDGTISTWAWDFGDGTRGSGSTVSHAYATAGTFVVTLTVTDDRGATATSTTSVTTTLPPNVAPTAAFTSSVAARTVTVDGAGSRDTDGRVVGWAWDFGNGVTASTAQASTTYAAPGTYTVTLTVTDDRGGSASTSAQVVVAAPALASDAFGRTVTSGWGRADVGGAWTTSGTTSVSNGAGVLANTAGRSSLATLSSVASTDVALQVTLARPTNLTGGGNYVSLATQRQGNSDYRVKVWYRADGTVQLILSRTVSNAETTLGTVTLPTSVSSAGAITVRFETSGTGTTTLRAKAWVAGAAEPTAWSVQASDSTAALQRAGAVMVQSYVSGTATAESTVRVDDLWVGAAGRTPQG